MKIAVDQNIPFILKPLQSLPGVEISHDLSREGVKDAEVIITRTRTKCNADLLDGSTCRFIATATIGTDHIDLPYCEGKGIRVVNAPGCNAPAVAQWVLQAVKETGGFKGRTLGVIGAGHVGSIIVRWAEGLGMKVLVNDPPLQYSDPTRFEFSIMEEIADKADIVTVHTPLTKSGLYPSFHLINDDFILSLKRKPLILNAARGAVADTGALLRGMEEGKIIGVGIDCWEGEPRINRKLLENALFATPHIAGYSKEGKVRATQMVLDALTDYMRLDKRLLADADLPSPVPEFIGEDMLTYDILEDTNRLKESPATFESQRNNYKLRPEPHSDKN